MKTVACCQRFEPSTLGRIAQLIQRSNQFNLTTRRYSETECESMMEDPERYYPFTISVRDRFGDFGLVNVVVLRLHPDEGLLEIDVFLMSCRVLQRGVEQLAMNTIFEHARSGHFERVVGRYIPTAKNMMVKNFFEQFGFRRVETQGGEAMDWHLEPDQYVPRRVFIDSERKAVDQP